MWLMRVVVNLLMLSGVCVYLESEIVWWLRVVG